MVVGVREWLRSQTVLITGATGFLGHSLVYKLLQCDCTKIYALVRSKKGQNAQERLEKMLNGYTFNTLRDKVDMFGKMKAIPCDSDASGLGISEHHLEILRNEVTVVFHGAASVKFDDPMKKAVITNIRMTKDILDLTTGLKHVQVFLYYSTAYSNCENMIDGIEEHLYEPKMSCRNIISAVETLPEEQLNSIEGKLLGASPNTYIFTKQLAESLVNEYGNKFPVVIVRPEIVLGGAKEPEPGWWNNLSSPCAIVVGSGMGVLRLYHGPSDRPKAYVPVDIVVNGSLITAWHKATMQSQEVVPVYNTRYQGLDTAFLKRMCLKMGESKPLRGALWTPHMYIIPNPTLFLIMHLLVHVLPGLFIDAALKLSGNKPVLTRVYRKTYMTFFLLKPFLYLIDKIKFDKFEAVVNGLSKEDAAVFYTDLDDPSDLKTYTYNLADGYRAFTGQPKEIHPKEIAHYTRMYYLDKCVTYLFFGWVLWSIPYTFIAAQLIALSDCLCLYFTNIFDVSNTNIKSHM